MKESQVNNVIRRPLEEIEEQRKIANANPAKFRKYLIKELTWVNVQKNENNKADKNERWFLSGKTNIVLNAVGKHSSGVKKNKAAIIWEKENGDSGVITYQMLSDHVNRLANALVSLNVKKGDIVTIYLGNIPELVISILACSSIGAIHNVVYNGYKSRSLKFRIDDPGTKVIITADSLLRMGAYLPLKENIDEVINGCPTVEKIVVVRSGNPAIRSLNSDKEIWYDELAENSNTSDRTELLNANHTAFITYASVAEEKPKQIGHLLGPYLANLYNSTKWLFGPTEQDILFTDYEPGNIRNISYGIYGPLLHGMTIFIYDGLPNSPSIDRYGEIIERNHITIFLTTPTQLRALKQLGNDRFKKYDFNSLRFTGISGEPVYRDTISWYKKYFGKNNAGLLNFWMQSETGTAYLASYSEAGVKEIKFLKPLPGVSAEVEVSESDSAGQHLPGFLYVSSYLQSIKELDSTPAKVKSLSFKNDKSTGWFFTGDGAIKAGTDCFDVLGRTDDVLKVGSHRFSRREIESVIKEHKDVKDAVAVRKPDNLKGTAVVVFIQLREGVQESVLLKEEIKNFAAANICRIAKPDELVFLDQFPLTSEGYINRKEMRSKMLELADNVMPDILKQFNILEQLRGEK